MATSRWLRIILLILAALATAAVLAVPFLIDVNRYRDVIQARASAALGREVRLGEMRLSLWPLGVRADDVAIGALPGEGAGDLLTAKRVRVGARLLPLVGKRLEVTSIVLQEPQLTLARGADGTWNVERLLAADAESGGEPTAASGGATLLVDKLRVTQGRITVRDAGTRGAPPVELTFAGFDLTLHDVALDRPVTFDLDTGLAGLPDARLRLSGRAGPLAAAPGERVVVEAEIDARKLDLRRLAELARGLASVPPDLLGARPASFSARLRGEFGDTGTLTFSDVRLADLDLALRRDRDGRLNLPAFGGTDGAAESGEGGLDVRVEGLRVERSSVALRDETFGAAPLELTLAGVDLTLDRLPGDLPASVELKCALESASGKGTLSVRGEIGPLAAGSETLPAELAVKIDRVPPALLRTILGDAVDLDVSRGSASLEFALSGSVPAAFDARGSLALAGFEVAIAGPDGRSRAVPIDVTVGYDVRVQDSGASLDIRELRLALRGNTLTLRGALREHRAVYQADLELLPARVHADDLAALLTLFAGELPFAFASATPLELAARIRGPLGGERLPEVEGTVRLRDFTLGHPSLAEPLRQVAADVTLAGEQVRIEGFSGVIGASDLAGSIGISGLDAPAVRFDLRAKRADFGELFSFLKGEEGSGSTASAAGGDPLGGMTLDGKLRIEQGTFQNLDFSALDATLKWRGAVATLEPVRMELYGGTFGGRIVGDLGGASPRWEIDGQADGVDVDAFLADNAGTPGVVTGRFTGQVGTRTTGGDYESLVRGLSGSGAVSVKEGRVGKLDVLETLSRVSGVFGETTLRQLSQQLATAGTDFRLLSSGVRLEEGGRMHLEDLLLDAPMFEISGGTVVDLLAGTLRGDFRLTLSREVSATMRTEGSRAAKLFWNARTSQVELPFGLSGPFDAPTPSVDFESIARRVVRDEAEDRLRDTVRDRLGLSLGEREPVAPQPAAQTPAALPPAEASGAPSTGTPSPAGLEARINLTRWGGPILLPDLKIEGTLRGPAIDHASLVVTDARGVEIRSVARLPDVDSAVAAGETQAIDWRAEVDGKKLALAKYPLRVRVIVTDAGGGTAETTAEVSKR